MAKPGSGRTKPALLTLADVESLAREHGAGDAWDALTPAQRRRWTARVRKQQAAEQKAIEKAKTEAARKASQAFDRFMAEFWAPVRKEQRAAARKKRR